MAHTMAERFNEIYLSRFDWSTYSDAKLVDISDEECMEKSQKQ